MIVFLSVRFYRNNIQKEFLAEKDLTFAKAFETAQPMEMPNREDFNEVRIPPEVSINKLTVFPVPGVQVRAQVFVFAVLKTSPIGMLV